MKSSAMQVNGEWRDVYKSPVGDVGKASKKGRLALVKNARGEVQTLREEALSAGQSDLLQTVFENGRIVESTTFEAVRERAAIGVNQFITSRAPL
jgi:nicotinamide phosphoribosyltransferase